MRSMPGVRQIRREVNPVVISAKDFGEKHQQKDRFMLRIIEEPKIYLIGTVDVLAELTENRSA